MTNHAHGSSLLQARGANHNGHKQTPRLEGHPLEQPPQPLHQRQHLQHLHLHQQHEHLQHRRHLRQHNHQHVRSHEDSSLQIDSSEIQHQHQIKPRQADIDPDSVITHVIQTVSVIQYVDGLGLPVAQSTVYAEPLTQLVDRLTGTTLDTYVVNDPRPTASSGPASVGATIAPPTLANASSTTESSTTLSTPLTSAPLPTASNFPSLSSGVFNSSSTAGLFGNTTLRTPFGNRTTASATLSPFASSSTLSLSSSASPSESSTTNEIASTINPFGAPAPAPTTDSTDATSSTGALTPAQTGQLVGGVVGGICGIALIVFAAFFVMRWRRQKAEGHRRLGDGGGDGPADTAGFSSRMSERGIPFAVPSALAALSGTKRQEPAELPAAGENERGFVRVSGRKLPSVLRHGGDGYTNPFADPRDSAGDASVMYRDSDIFFSPPPVNSTTPPGSGRLKLGSPMRPESGIPVIQPGPRRTPVTEEGPVFAVRSSPGPFMSPPRPVDAIGRSHPSRDGSRASRVSQSRFTENIS